LSHFLPVFIIHLIQSTQRFAVLLDLENLFDVLHTMLARLVAQGPGQAKRKGRIYLIGYAHTVLKSMQLTMKIMSASGGSPRALVLRNVWKFLCCMRATRMGFLKPLNLSSAIDPTQIPCSNVASKTLRALPQGKFRNVFAK
jgi:hypothetical protein